MNTQEKIDALKAARKLIEQPEHWGKGSFALTSEGNPTTLFSKDAVCFCAHGAVARAVGKNPHHRVNGMDVLVELAVGLPRHPTATLPQTKVYEWNDHNATHEQVLAHFDATIARLELSLTP